jgi:hypothetical protein
MFFYLLRVCLLFFSILSSPHHPLMSSSIHPPSHWLPPRVVPSTCRRRPLACPAAPLTVPLRFLHQHSYLESNNHSPPHCLFSIKSPWPMPPLFLPRCGHGRVATSSGGVVCWEARRPRRRAAVTAARAQPAKTRYHCLREVLDGSQRRCWCYWEVRRLVSLVGEEEIRPPALPAGIHCGKRMYRRMKK